MEPADRSRPVMPLPGTEPDLRLPGARAHGPRGGSLRRSEAVRRLLVLDDDPAMGAFIGEVASLAGFEVTATTEPEAFRLAALEPNEVIVLDLVLPGTDGIALIHGLASAAPTAGLILVSGLDARILESASSVARSLGIPVLGHLQKPFRAVALRELLARAGSASVPVAPAPARPACSGADLTAAIDAGQVILHYQPQVRIADGEWVGAEALVRWQHPTLGLLTPDAFLQAADDPEIGLALTEHVLRTAATEWAGIRTATGRDLGLSVNVPAEVLAAPGLVERIRAVVDAAGLPCDALTIEVTEGRLSVDLNGTLEALTRLRVLGFGLAIDDFGTGHSTLERLHRVPFTELKIDRQFIRGIGTDPWARTIAAQSITLGRALELRTVAEGVEDQAAWEWLVAAGCTLAQGYLVARPIAPGALESWSAGWSAARGSGRAIGVPA